MPKPKITYRPTEPADVASVNRILMDAFTSSDPADSEQIALWTKTSGTEHLRTLESDGAIVGTTRLIEMGQYFGGKRVEMVGIAGVAISPEARTSGVGRVLMDETLKELYERSTPISVLYASASAFYRKVGYETAGASYFHRIPLELIPRTTSPLTIRPYEQADQPAIESCYERTVQDRDGSLARGKYIWQRVRCPSGKRARGFVFDRPSTGIEGYIFYRQQPIPSVPFPMELFATDLCAITPDAKDTLFTYLRGYSSMCSHLVFEAGPFHPIAMSLAQQCANVRMHEYWMLRVIDVKRALEQRGYPRGKDANLCFELKDESLPGNTGVWTLTVNSGSGSLEKGGSPTLILDARAMAALYTGFASARDLRIWSTLRCDDEHTLNTCDALFRGPSPAMAEMF